MCFFDFSEHSICLFSKMPFRLSICNFVLKAKLGIAVCFLMGLQKKAWCDLSGFDCGC